VAVPLPTSRLRFRLFTEADRDLVTAVVTDPHVVRYIEVRPLSPEEAAAKVLPEILQRYREYPGYGRFAVERRTDGSFVGWMSVRPAAPSEAAIVQWPMGERDAPVVEIGYRLLPSAWGQGLATEATKALLAYAVDVLEAEVFVATTMVVNVRSRRVLERLGFRLTHVVHVAWEEPIPGAEQGEAEYRLNGPHIPR
jgi:RimJ/RimL family protein N-acetyltransferase